MSVYFSLLPTPSSKTPSNTSQIFQSIESLEQEEERVRMQSGGSLVSNAMTPTFSSYYECSHPEDQLDTESGMCHSCAAYTERVVAPLSECGGGFGGNRHAVTSAYAAAKRRRLAAAMIKDRSIVINHSLGQRPLSSTSNTVYKHHEITDSEKSKVKSAVSIWFENSVEYHTISPPTARVTYATEKTMTGISRRVLYLIEAAKLAFYQPSTIDNPISIIPSGAFRYQDRETCPTIEKLALAGENVNERAVELSNAVVNNVGQFVQSHLAYFNSSQRRRLNHISIFVAILGSHAEIIHGSNIEEAGVCFEIDRVNARARPSQSRFCKRSFVFALSERFGISITCSTRLIQEVLKLIKGD